MSSFRSRYQNQAHFLVLLDGTDFQPRLSNDAHSTADDHPGSSASLKVKAIPKSDI